MKYPFKQGFLDLKGEKFGKLTVLEYRGKNKRSESLWKCICECGKETTVPSARLKCGHTKSCGCFRKETTIKNHTTHGESKGKLYLIWKNMKKRCYDERAIGFKNYGGRGIKVCDEWKDSSETFIKWARSNGYEENLSIERIDVNGNYEPSNCTFVEHIDQMNNTTRTVWITYNGKKQSLSNWCRELGVFSNYEAIRTRVSKYGWSFEKAISVPVKKKPRKVKK